MSLYESYESARNYSMQLFSPLNPEDYTAQPAEFASPPKWNLAHTSWFFEEFILKDHFKDYKLFNTQYSYLFNSYYINAGLRFTRARRGVLTRPLMKDIFAYREYVDSHMKILLKEEPFNAEINYLTMLGINHEQQHQELFLTDIKYTFGIQPMFPAYSNDPLSEKGQAGSETFVSVDEGIYNIGFGDKTDFCYDNEKQQHKVFLHGFSLCDSLVSNAEYAAFIKDGGYENPNLWHSEGFSRVEKYEARAPLYWLKKKGEWMHYTLAGLRPLAPDAPLCHVNYYEAAAFAAWKGMRLPTEFEWEAASEHFSWGQRWEWTESAYLPYPGYKKDKGALGEYNGKFMVNQKVLRGASVATSPGHSRKTYRNFFHPDMSWQFSGIRLAK